MSTESRSQSPIRLGLLAVLAIAIVGAGVWAVLNERGDDAVAASLDDFELTFGDVNELLSTIPANTSADGVVGRELAQANSLVSTTMLVEAVAADLLAEGVDPADFEESALLTLSTQGPFDPTSAFGEWSIRLEAVQQALSAWSRAEVLAQLDPSAPPVILCSSHILVETEGEADAVVAELDAGADFALLAAERSIGPSGPGGGDLGCVDPATFVPEFGAAAEANGPGVTSPVQTQFGWHVILVRSYGPLTAENHPQLSSEEIDRLLVDEPTRAAVGESLLQRASLRAIQDSTIDPRFGQWDPATGRLDLPNGVTG